MIKLTKIVATIGPVTESEEMIKQLIEAGVNVFRFNLKHNTMDWHHERILRVNKVSDSLQIPVGILIDLQGPEIRLTMPVDQIEIKKDDLLLLGEEAMQGKEKGFSISHPDIISHLKEGQKIIADDGAFCFSVVKKDEKSYLKSEVDGVLKNRKSLNIPGADFPFPVLMDHDFEALELAAKSSVDYIALSFVRTVADVETLKKEMEKRNIDSKIVSKIETQKAVEDIDAIIRASDAIMVARGDLGVEIPLEEVPYYQKMIIKKCVQQGIPVITATQMLQSMIENPFPTRAEISDIANATYDYTDAVMLSGETASGNYPLNTVNVMRKTVQFHEVKSTEDMRVKFHFSIEDVESMICDAAYNLYLQSIERSIRVAGFLVFSHTGKTARLLSRYRPTSPIYTFCPTKKVGKCLTANFGVIPFVHAVEEDKEVNRERIEEAIEILVAQGHLHKDEKIIVLHGNHWCKVGGTSTVKILSV